MSGTLPDVHSYRDLIVWQKAMALVTRTYQLTRAFPREELYGLTSQARRCAVSIPNNIAEGCGRHSTVDYVRFLRVASGSLFELQTQMEIAKNLRYMNPDDFLAFEDATKEIERMLSSLIQKLGLKLDKR